jgi:hypothetical protein
VGLVSGIWLLLLGVLAVPSLIVARQANAKQVIDKIAPYQGWIGAVSCLWGVWGIISAILSLGWIAHIPIYWATYLADALLQFSLGLILGIGVLKTFIKAPAAQAKMDQTLAKLSPKQGMLGVGAIGLGIWMIIAGFIWRVG